MNKAQRSARSTEGRHKSSFVLTNDLGYAARSLRIAFAFAPTGVEKPNLLSQPDSAPLPVRLSARGYEVDFDWGEQAIEPGAEIAFQVWSQHSLIEIAHICWSNEPQPRPEDGEPEAPEEPEVPEVPDEPEAPEAPEGPDWPDEPAKDCRDFFAEYDRRFLPSDVRDNEEMTTEERAERIRTVPRMMDTLLWRRDERARAALQDRLPEHARLRRRGLRDDVEHLSEAQLELFRECFPHGEGGIDYSAFQRCFERFANGELRNPANPGEREPDGGYFFLFAEFAFLAISLATSPAAWKKLLRTFVKCQELFISAYRPPGVQPYRLDDYQAKNYRRGSGEEKKRELREKYDDKSPGELEKEARNNMRDAQNPPE